MIQKYFLKHLLQLLVKKELNSFFFLIYVDFFFVILYTDNCGGKMKIMKLLLIIIWMLIIFNFSNQPAQESSELSDGFIIKTVRIIEKITNGSVDEEFILKTFVKPVRKTAHFTVYLILGVLVFLFLKEFDLNTRRQIVISILICLMYASSDEIHQLFVSGRSGEVLDVCIDTFGSFVGINIVNLLLKKRHKQDI